MPKYIFWVLNFLAVSVLVVACGAPPSTDTDTGKPEVITTVGMIADVAENVAGGCALVTPLMGPGTDPHTYRASARDSRTLAVAEAAIPRGEIIATDSQYGVDPHVWMDVALWSRTADVIAARLGRLERKQP